MRLQDRPAMAADLGRGRAAGLAHPLHQLDRRRRTHRKPLRRRASGAPCFNCVRDPLAQILRHRCRHAGPRSAPAPTPGIRTFDRIAAFARYHPDWPVMAVLSRRAEEALLVARKPPAVVRAFFAERRPTGAAGKVALALALKRDGLEYEAATLVRDAWRNDTFGRELEARILGLFPGVLTQVDHRDRMERFLFREDWASALKAAGYAGNDYVLLAT